jgi:hypothetical protein
MIHGRWTAVGRSRREEEGEREKRRKQKQHARDDHNHNKHHARTSLWPRMDCWGFLQVPALNACVFETNWLFLFTVIRSTGIGRSPMQLSSRGISIYYLQQCNGPSNRLQISMPGMYNYSTSGTKIFKHLFYPFISYREVVSELIW